MGSGNKPLLTTIPLVFALIPVQKLLDDEL